MQANKSKLQDDLKDGMQLLKLGLFALFPSGGLVLAYYVTPALLLLAVALMGAMMGLACIVVGALKIAQVVSALIRLLPEDEAPEREEAHLPFAADTDNEE
jgi:hypothetical protein